MKSTRALIAAFSVFILALNAGATGNSGVSYEGTLIKPDTTPEQDSVVQFKLQIRSPNANDCLMYEETQTIDMSSSNGNFALTINDGSGTRTDSSGYTLDRIFANAGSFTLPSPVCTSGSNYAPSPSDGRNLAVYFKDSTMGSWEPIPAEKINFVPYAIESKQIAGFTANSLVRVQEADGTMDSVSPLSNAQYTALLALANGSSTQYAQAGQLGGVALPTMTSGQVLGWNGTAWVSQAPVPAGSITASQIATSAIGTSQISNTVSISTSGTLASSVATTRDFQLFAASPSTFSIDMQAPALSSSYALVWPMTAGSVSQVLTTDGSGHLSWSSPGTSQWQNNGSSIYYNTGNVGIGTTAPTAGFHLKAGTATPGTAPLKFTAGTLLTTPEDGAMEYSSGTGLYFTVGSTRYVIPTNTSAGNYSNVSSVGNSSGSITMTPMSGNSLIVNASTTSTSPSTGALIVNGGAGIAGALNAAGNISAGGAVTATTSATAPQIYGSSAASGVLRIDSTSNATPGVIALAAAGGRVGIGTTSPSATFHVFQTTTAAAMTVLARHELVVAPTITAPYDYTAEMNSSTDSGAQTITSLYGTQSSAQHATTTTLTNSAGAYNVSNNISSGAITNAYGTWNVISNGSPGTITNAYGERIDFSNTGTITNGYGLYIGTVTGTNNYGIFQSGSANKNKFAGQILGTNGAASVPGFAFSTSPMTGLFSPTTDNLAVSTAGTERVRIDSSGNMGIGTTTPTYPLDVAGPMRAQYLMPSAVVTPGSACSGALGGALAVSSVNGQLAYCSGTVWTQITNLALGSGTTTIDFLQSTAAVTASSCSTPFSLYNLKSGQTYRLLIKGSSATTCTLNLYSDAGTTALTSHASVTLTSVASKYNQATITVYGTDAVVDWESNL